MNAPEKNARLTLRVSADKMVAYLKSVPPKVGEQTGEDNELPSPDEAVNYLQSQGVIHGIDYEAIIQAVGSQTGEEIIVSRGTPPVPGKDAELKLIYLKKLEKQRASSENKIDYFDRSNIISVDPGELLAVKIPPVPGTPGKNVFGQEVPPPAPKDFALRAGAGAHLSEDGLSVVASISGRPVHSGFTIGVLPVLTITGDVNAETGYIRFKGDVVVYGNVTEGMKIEASGQVEVHGIVSQSNIVARNNVIIHKNLLGSEVKAGESVMELKLAREKSAQVARELEALVSAVRQLKSSEEVIRHAPGTRRADGVFVKLLLESKFSNLPKLVKEAIHLAASLKGRADQELEKSLHHNLNSISSYVTGLGPLNVRDIDELEKLVPELATLLTQLDALLMAATSRADVVVGYVQSSRIQASGSVRITGRGCYYSQILAGGDVIIDGVPGLFRNGSINAGGNVKVRELGSPSEAATVVQVPPKHYIIADKVHPGVMLKAGTRAEKMRSSTLGLRFGEE